jgi:hypothetical protein
MKQIAQLLVSLAITLALPGTSVMAEIGFMRDVNTACNTGLLPIDDVLSPLPNDAQITVECSVCHDINDFDQETRAQELYESHGACLVFCPEASLCAPVRPTGSELLADAQGVTNQYFEKLFKEFMKHMKDTGMMDPDGTINNPMIFAEVFPDCSQIAPVIGGDFSRKTGYLMRRVTNRTRNARNTPDTWEASQLKRFEKMAEEGKPRTQFDITKPDGTILPTKEFETWAITDGPDDTKYFRYMRSITMPGPPNEPPHLPCLKCHGTFEQLGPGLVEVDGDYAAQGILEAEYPYDLALGYKKGDIRGAWTIKIPIVEGGEDD